MKRKNFVLYLLFSITVLFHSPFC